jgi:Domain of unknown function (DUF6429)
LEITPTLPASATTARRFHPLQDVGPTKEEVMDADLDLDRIDQAVLALLCLGLHDGRRVWESFDWDALDCLHAKGMITDPVSRAKSVVLTDTGLATAKRLLVGLFVART